MGFITDISQYLGKTFGFYSDYVELVILTILIFIVFGIKQVKINLHNWCFVIYQPLIMMASLMSMMI